MGLEAEVRPAEATRPKPRDEDMELSVCRSLVELNDMMFKARQMDIFELEVTEAVLSNIQKHNYNPEPKFMHYHDFTLYLEGCVDEVKRRDGRTVAQVQRQRSIAAKKNEELLDDAEL